MMLFSQGYLMLCTLASCTLQVLAVETRPHDNITMEDLTDHLRVAQPPIPGTTPLTGLRSSLPDLRARDCLSNGTNYCFGNNVDYCLGCGLCCQDSIDRKWCCSLDSTCCGSQCCAKGQSCSNGQCYLPVISVTKTSTLFVTSVHRFTQIATVFEDVVQTSTVNMVTQITVSSLATQTDVQWVTTTVADAKRAIPSQGAAALRHESVVERNSSGSFDIANVLRRLFEVFHRRSNGRDDSPRDVENDRVYPRQETQLPLSASASTATLISYITQIADKTSITSSTTTHYATSTVLTTIYQTATHVLDAQTTVSVTSTLTLRPPTPTTITKTEFATLPPDSPSTAQPSTSSTRTPGLAIPTGQSSSEDGPVLSTPAIAGIAAGGFVAILLIAGIAILICLRRGRRQTAAAAARIEDDLNAYYGIPPAPTTMLRREPKMPPANIFAPTSPDHHSAAFQPVVATARDGRGTSSHTAATTIVGSAASPVQGAKSPRASSVGTVLSSPAEVAGADVPPRYEVEGSSPPVGGHGGGGGWGEGHARLGSDVSGRSRRSGGGYFGINF